LRVVDVCGRIETRNYNDLALVETSFDVNLPGLSLSKKEISYSIIYFIFHNAFCRDVPVGHKEEESRVHSSKLLLSHRKIKVKGINSFQGASCAERRLKKKLPQESSILEMSISLIQLLNVEHFLKHHDYWQRQLYWREKCGRFFVCVITKILFLSRIN
jgi:hypothetical protein